MSTVKFDKWLSSTGVPRNMILQVQQSVLQGTYAGTGGGADWLDTGFQCSITPKYASSKIMLTAQLMTASAYWELQGKFQRNGTDIGVGDSANQLNEGTRCGFNCCHYMNNYRSFWYPTTYTFLDSPNSTSQQTYKLWLNGFGANSVYLNRTRDDYDNADYHGCPISTIILMEIAA